MASNSNSKNFFSTLLILLIPSTKEILCVFKIATDVFIGMPKLMQQQNLKSLVSASLVKNILKFTSRISEAIARTLYANIELHAID